MLELTEADVQRLLPMSEAISAVESVLREMSLNEAMNVPRSRCQTDGAMLHVLSGAAKRINAMGVKVYGTSKKGAYFRVLLFDGTTGEPTAIIEADHLGRIRTGAASGVATNCLAREDAESVGIFGTGRQARTQLLAVSEVRPIKRVSVYSRDEGHRARFAEEMGRELGAEVVAVSEPKAACSGHDIVITATTSTEPIITGGWIDKGTHLNVVGSNFRAKAEVDAEAVGKCELIAVDSKDQAKIEAGDLTQAISAGAITWGDVCELGDLIAGRRPGRTSADDITMFKSLGIGLEDIAVAALVVERAKQEGKKS